jgi:hypothetical protein
VDVEWWEDLVHGEKPLQETGFAKVPEAPGLGVTINEDEVKKRLHKEHPGFFEPTPQWDRDRVNDRLWSMAPRKGDVGIVA